MRLAIGIAVWAAGFAWGGLEPAWAQVDTPQNCWWVSLPKDPATIEMWCREQDGRAHPTGRLMRQAPPDVWDGCPNGRVYDGARCVTEAQALNNTNRLWAAAPPPAPTVRPAPLKASKPRVLMFQDREGRRGRGMACADQTNVTVCKPIPHY